MKTIITTWHYVQISIYDCGASMTKRHLSRFRHFPSCLIWPRRHEAAVWREENNCPRQLRLWGCIAVVIIWWATTELIKTQRGVEALQSSLPVTWDHQMLLALVLSCAGRRPSIRSSHLFAIRLKGTVLLRATAWSPSGLLPRTSASVSASLKCCTDKTGRFVPALRLDV